MGWFTFTIGIYQDTFGYRNPEQLSIIPYIFSYFMFLLLLKPFDTKIHTEILTVRFSNRRIEMMIYFLSVSLILTLFVQLYMNISSFSFAVLDDYGEMYRERSTGDVTREFSSPILNFVYDKSIAIGRILLPIVYSLLFMAIVGNRRKKKLKIGLVILITVEIILTKLVNANRGGMFFSTMTLTFFVATFYNSFIPKIKRLVWILFGSGFVVLSIIISIVSVSRFDGDSVESSNQTLRYFGEPFPNLGYNIWGKEIRHPGGIRFFPSTSESLGLFKKQEFSGRNSKFNYWERYVGIPMLNFKTIFGDLYIEFGVIGAFLFLSIGYFTMMFLIRRNKGIVSRVTMQSLWYDLVIFGIFGNSIDEIWIINLFYTLAMLLLLEIFVFSHSSQTSKLCWSWK